MPPDMGEEKIYNTSMSKNNLAYTNKFIFVHIVGILYTLIKLL